MFTRLRTSFFRILSCGSSSSSRRHYSSSTTSSSLIQEKKQKQQVVVTQLSEKEEKQDEYASDAMALPISPSQIRQIEVARYRRLIFVGDIHGCMEEFLDLLVKVDYQDDQDALILLGDLVGKGPHSLRVFQWAYERRDSIFVIKGNHEAYLQLGRINPENIRGDHQNIAREFNNDFWEWLETWPLVLDIPEHRIYAIHAGANPYKSLLYHREAELTNMRNIVDLDWSANLEKGEPWAKVWNDHQSLHVKEEDRYTIIFGHDAVRGLQLYDYAIGTDTGAVYGNKLTAYVYPQREFVHQESRAMYAEPITPAEREARERLKALQEMESLAREHNEQDDAPVEVEAKASA